MSLAPVLLSAVASVLPPVVCWQFDLTTHAAWVRSEAVKGQRLELEVERWVWGPEPRPGRVVIEVSDPRIPMRLYAGPAESPYLAALALDKAGKWRLEGRLIGAHARSFEETGLKLVQHGTILSGWVKPVPLLAVITATEGQYSRSQDLAADGSFEILGLPRGRYELSVTVEGYRQRVSVRANLAGRCWAVEVPIEKYGLSERVRDALFPVESYARAVWSLVAESLAPGKGR